MSPTTGVLVAAALLLGAAGIGKTARPGPAARALLQARVPARGLLARRAAVRTYGVVEVLAAVAVLVVGGRVAAVVVTVGFALLCGVAARIAAAAPGVACGCFGTGTDRVSLAHLAVTGSGVLVGVVGLVRPPDALPALLADAPGTAVVVVVAAAVLAVAAYATLAALPALSAARAALTSPGGTS